MNLQVGSHTPPPFYEVPVLVRQFCDDLVARITGAAQKFDPLTYAETLAFADWRFQWIHPFRDFNGRVGRIILTAVLHLLNLPPAETAAVEPEARERYLAALRAADKGDLSTLTDIWTERLERAVEDSEKE
jgi:Fic family protein